MALLKRIELPETGASAEYWRITHVTLDRVAGIVEAVVHGYLDQGARIAGRNPMARLAFRVVQAAMDDPCILSLEDLYAAVKAEPAGQDEAGTPLPPVFDGAADI
ncbi:MAG: hypothetical protein K2X11_06355 [Acetobacteraceae bacterium]|nr:hypothetical protein [Acetobacteraceae bacterium]